MILLDTHVWIRWFLPDDPLPPTLLERLENAEDLAVSAISCWEVVLLQQRGRIELPLQVNEWLFEATRGSSVVVIPISCEIARLAGQLPEHHKDPADRLIIATAIERNIHLASLDGVFVNYTELRGLLTTLS